MRQYDKDTLSILVVCILIVLLVGTVGQLALKLDRISQLEAQLREKPSAAVEYRPTVLIKVPVECSIAPMWEIEQAKVK